MNPEPLQTLLDALAQLRQRTPRLPSRARVHPDFWRRLQDAWIEGAFPPPVAPDAATAVHHVLGVPVVPDATIAPGEIHWDR